MVSDKIISQLIRDGNSDAFSLVFNTYYKDLVLFAMKFVGNSDIAEDIVQDIFAKIWETHNGFYIETSIKSYLLSSVKNRCFDKIRHNKIIDKHHNYVKIYESFESSDVEHYILYSDFHKEYSNVVDSLPDNIKQTFLLSREKGLKNQEVANLLGVSLRTVEDRISSALRIIRKKLNHFCSFLCGFVLVIRLITELI